MWKGPAHCESCHPWDSGPEMSKQAVSTSKEAVLPHGLCIHPRPDLLRRQSMTWRCKMESTVSSQSCFRSWCLITATETLTKTMLPALCHVRFALSLSAMFTGTSHDFYKMVVSELIAPYREGEGGRSRQLWAGLGQHQVQSRMEERQHNKASRLQAISGTARVPDRQERHGGAQMRTGQQTPQAEAGGAAGKCTKKRPQGHGKESKQNILS